jgi:hypothetical protein
MVACEIGVPCAASAEAVPGRGRSSSPAGPPLGVAASPGDHRPLGAATRAAIRVPGTPSSPSSTIRARSTSRAGAPLLRAPSCNSRRSVLRRSPSAWLVALLPGWAPPWPGGAVEMSDGEVVGQDALWVVGCEGESRGEQQACLPRAEVTGEHGPDTCQARTSGGVEGFDGA